MTPTSKSSKVKRQRRAASHDADQLIRVVRPGGLVYDVHMTEAQMKEARHVARSWAESGMKKSMNDVILELLDSGIVSAVSYSE